MYRLQKTGCGIASWPRVYASLECEIQCLEKVKSQKHKRASGTTPPLMVMIFALEPLSATPGEGSQCTYIFVSMLLWLDWSYRYILWMIQYVVKTSGKVVCRLGSRWRAWDVGLGNRRSQHAVAMKSQQAPNPGRIPGGGACLC